MKKMMQYSTAQYSTAQYSTVQYSTVQYSTVQYSTVQYSTVQYSIVQYSPLCCITPHSSHYTLHCLLTWLHCCSFKHWSQLLTGPTPIRVNIYEYRDLRFQDELLKIGRISLEHTILLFGRLWCFGIFRWGFWGRWGYFIYYNIDDNAIVIAIVND